MIKVICQKLKNFQKIKISIIYVKIKKLKNERHANKIILIKINQTYRYIGLYGIIIVYGPEPLGRPCTMSGSGLISTDAPSPKIANFIKCARDLRG